MKKVAVVFFGQPRFIEKTYKSILQEFSFPGYETDFFSIFGINVVLTVEILKQISTNNKS